MRRHQLNTDGPFPDDTPVAVHYDPTGRAGDKRDCWPLMAGTVVGRVGDDEWEVAVDDPRAAAQLNGETTVPDVYRTGSELTAITEREWSERMGEAQTAVRREQTSDRLVESGSNCDGPLRAGCADPSVERA